MKVAVFAVALLCCVALTFATLGVDVSAPVSSSDWSCLKGKGYVRGIVRAWESTGNPDSNAPASIQAAKSAGISVVDVYLFPCAGKSASSQMSGMLSYLQQHGASFGTVWLDIEQNPSSGCGWSSSTSTNCQFISQLISAAGSQSVGVYASESEWSSIAGSSCTVGASKPLWYPHYDNNPSFSDFQPFGGWTKPYMKQYVGDATVCGVGVDENYYGGGNATGVSSSGATQTGSSSGSTRSGSSSGSTRSGSSSGSTRSGSSSGSSKPSGTSRASSGGSNSQPSTTQSSTHTSATGPSSTGPSSTHTTGTGPSSTGPSSTGPSSTGPSSTGPSSTGPSSTGPSSTGASGPSSTGASGPSSTGASGPSTGASGPSTGASSTGQSSFSSSQSSSQASSQSSTGYPQSTSGGSYPQSTSGGSYPQSTSGGSYPQSTSGGSYPQSSGYTTYSTTRRTTK